MEEQGASVLELKLKTHRESGKGEINVVSFLEKRNE
jgi:hypothetical protein